MNFHGVETQTLCVPGSLRKRPDHIINILLGHHMAGHLAGHIHSRRRVTVDIALRHHAALAHAAAVPELRGDLAALGVNGINDRLPTCQTLFSMKVRHVGIAVGGDVIRAGALGNYEPHTPCRTSPVIGRRGLAGNVVRRMVTGHGCHDDTVLGAQRFKREGIK